jgi:hypothetical protein
MTCGRISPIHFSIGVAVLEAIAHETDIVTERAEREKAVPARTEATEIG